MPDFLIYIILGLSVGYIGGYAGIGGAPFLVAFLVLVCGMTQIDAQGTVLTMMLGPMSLLGVMSLYSYIKQLWAHIVVGVLSYCLFSYFGALLAFYLGENLLRTYFALLLVLIALIQLWKLFSKSKNTTQTDKISLLWVFVLTSVTGALGGLFGIGAGVLIVPILISVFRLKKEYARALSLAILLPPVSYGAFVKYNSEITINWQLVLILFSCYFIANYFGAKSGSNASEKTFGVIYTSLLVGIAIIYLI